MDYRYLQAFLTVAKTSSISAAAAQLNIAQSAVSRQIGLIEEMLNTDLFFRGARGVRLTPKGEELFRKTVQYNDWLETEFHKAEKPIRIGGLEGALNHWLGPKLAKAPISSMPANLFLKPMNDLEVQNSLEAGTIDIGFSSQRLETERISSRKLYSEKIFVIAKEKVNLDKITQYTWIGVYKTTYLTKLARNKSPERKIQSGSIDLLLHFVRGGHGIAALSEKLIPEKGFVRTPTNLSGENIYLNLPAYKKLPKHLDSFVKHFLVSEP